MMEFCKFNISLNVQLIWTPQAQKTGIGLINSAQMRRHWNFRINVCGACGDLLASLFHSEKWTWPKSILNYVFIMMEKHMCTSLRDSFHNFFQFFAWILCCFFRLNTDCEWNRFHWDTSSFFSSTSVHCTHFIHLFSILSFAYLLLCLFFFCRLIFLLLLVFRHPCNFLGIMHYTKRMIHKAWIDWDRMLNV